MALPSVPLNTAQETEVEVPEPDPGCIDSELRLASPATPLPAEAFIEELLQEAHLPKGDGNP